ncbi:hypothetical protein Tco_1445105, partial [Tanacetum coccineum]
MSNSWSKACLMYQTHASLSPNSQTLRSSSLSSVAKRWVGFNVPISNQITAGCDIPLMPSIFEPCGLNQLYPMRYGTRGLRDTVNTFNPYAERRQKGRYQMGLLTNDKRMHVG